MHTKNITPGYSLIPRLFPAKEENALTLDPWKQNRYHACMLEGFLRKQCRGEKSNLIPRFLSLNLYVYSYP
jgi:hypothetical protein